MEEFILFDTIVPKKELDDKKENHPEGGFHKIKLV